jgi:hypothetical protein
MLLSEKIKQFFITKTKQTSNFFHKIIHLFAGLVGIRKKERGYNCQRIVSTGWVFLIGIPIGYIFLGTLFSIPIWASIVLVMTILCNLDHIYEIHKIKQTSCAVSWT